MHIVWMAFEYNRFVTFLAASLLEEQYHGNIKRHDLSLTTFSVYYCNTNSLYQWAFSHSNTRHKTENTWEVWFIFASPKIRPFTIVVLTGFRFSARFIQTTYLLDSFLTVHMGRVVTQIPKVSGSDTYYVPINAYSWPDTINTQLLWGSSSYLSILPI